VNRRAIVEPFHPKIRLVVERFSPGDAKADAEFGGERD
jgi:hypothetical protein